MERPIAVMHSGNLKRLFKEEEDNLLAATRHCKCCYSISGFINVDGINSMQLLSIF